MKGMKVLFKKEVQDYLNSPISYIILFVFLGLTGWFFTTQVINSGMATLDGFVTIVPFLFLFLLPAVTMKLIAEEETRGTAEILETLPLKRFEIVLAKYLGAVTFICIMLIPTLIYPITLAIIGKIEWGVVFTIYLGIILLGATVASFGIFTSAVTKNQIGSYILAFLIVFFFAFIGKVLNFMPSWLVPIADYIGFDSHFDGFARGIIDTKDLIYFLSLIGIFLFFTYNTYRRYRTRALRGFLAGSIVIGVILLNLISSYAFLRIDCTKNKRYSLSKTTVRFIRSLEKPLIIKAYISRDLPFPYSKYSKYVSDFLTEYRSRSRGKVKVQFIDPVKENKRNEAYRAGIQPLTFTEMGSASYQAKEGYIGMVLIYGAKKEVIPVVGKISDLEYQVTKLIRKMSLTQKPVLSILSGHRSMEIPQDVMGYLRDNYDIKYANLKTDIEGDLLLIVAPNDSFPGDELKKIDDFLMKGKKLALFINRYTFSPQNFFLRPNRFKGLDSLISKYGLNIDKGIVLDTRCERIMLVQNSGGFRVASPVLFPPFVICTRYFEKLRGPESVLFPIVSPVGGDSVQVMAQSSKKSWLLKKAWFLNPYGKDLIPDRETEFKSFPLAVYKKGIKSAFSDSTNKDAAIFLCGTANLISKDVGGVTGKEFFLNTIDWLMEMEDLISIRSKPPLITPVKIKTKRAFVTFRLFEIIFPILCVLGYGYIRWRRRRNG